LRARRDRERESGVDEEKKRYAAIASIILGFVNFIIGFCLPPCGGVLVLVGVGLGIVGVRSESKLIGWIGIGVNCVALIVVIAAQTFNIMLATGQIQMQDVVEELSGREIAEPDAGAEDADAGLPLMPWPEDVGTETETETE